LQFITYSQNFTVIDKFGINLPDDEFGVKFGHSTRNHMKAESLNQWHNRVFKKLIYVLLIACIVFAPLLFINIRNSIDWGDDNVQYIHQAKNIVEGIPQSQTGYIYNENYPVGGPRAYPVGFPLLLAIAYALFGYNLYAFTFVVAVCTFILSLLMTLFFMRYFRALPAIILTALFVYNPQVLMFKEEVVSDLPFAMFLVAATLLYTAEGRRTYLQSVLIAILIGMLISIKSIGLFFPMAILADTARIAFIRFKGNRNDKPELDLLSRFIMVAGGIGVFALLNFIIFRMPSGGGISDYLNIFDLHKQADTILQNMTKYVEVVRYIFVPQVNEYQAFALAAGSISLALLFFGMARKVMHGFDFVDILSLSYLAILLVYPYNAGAFRFMIPAGFLLLYYIALGLRSFNPGVPLSGLNKAIVAGSLMFILFLPGLKNILGAQHVLIPGPQEKAPLEAFAWIKANTPADAVIAFAKSRAMAFYTDRHGFSNPKDQDITQMHIDFRNAGVTHLLASKSLSDQSFMTYVRQSRSQLDSLWGNEEFILYRYR
jgi:hypothetical protein